MDYIVITVDPMEFESGKLTELERKVNELMKEGYTPLGGICVTEDPDEGRNFWQAMVKTSN